MSLSQSFFSSVATVLLAVVSVLNAQVEVAPTSDANIHLRGRFQNARRHFENQKKGHVAFIGGSITEMNGYRPLVMAILQRRFPETEFTFTDAGISSTCSTTGAFRLHDHVLSKGPVDLFFVEFAVNDDQDAHHAYRECLRGMEGIVRRTRRHNPNADIVIVYFINPGMLATWQAGQIPLSVRAHDEVARHYGVSTINLAKETAEQIQAGTLTWEQYGGTHPGPIGNTLCATLIDRLMSKAWRGPIAPGAGPIAHPMPDALDARSYFHGRLIAPDQTQITRGMAVRTPDWSTLAGACRGRFAKSRLLCAEEPGAELTLPFQGTAVGAYVLAGPDAGIVEVSIDGRPSRAVNLYDDYSKGLHYPRTVMFDADLKPGKHILRLRVSDEKDPRSSGHALRVLHFVENSVPLP